MIDNIERGPVLFPPITFVFAGGIIVNWAPQAYLFPSDSPRGLWCHAFQDNGADQSTVLGISWMLYKDVIFDLNNRVLGVAEANCPEYSRADEFEKAGPPPSQSNSGSLGVWVTFVCMVLLVATALAVVLTCRCRSKRRVMNSYEDMTDSE